MLEDLTPKQQQFVILWNKGHSYKDISKKLSIKPSTIYRWRQQENVKIVMNNLSQDRYLESFHMDSIIMEQVRTKLMNDLNSISMKDLVWLYQTMTKHQQSKSGPFPRNKAELHVHESSRSIIGEKVDAWTDNNLERLFEESFLEEE